MLMLQYNDFTNFKKIFCDFRTDGSTKKRSLKLHTDRREGSRGDGNGTETETGTGVDMSTGARMRVGGGA